MALTKFTLKLKKGSNKNFIVLKIGNKLKFRKAIFKINK